MNILYDYQIFQYQKYGGISRYFFELMNHVSNECSVKLPVIFSNNHYLENKKDMHYFNFFKNIDFKGKQRLMEIPNRYSSALTLREQKFDIFHPTYYNPYFLKYIDKKPFILTVYDMIHERFKNKFSIKDKTSKLKELLVQRATKIIAISEHTKKDLMEIFGTRDDKIETVYLGNSLKLSNTLDYNIKVPQRYILFVGTRNGYKNFNVFIESVSTILKKYDEINIVCVGGGCFNNWEYTLFNKLGIANRIFQYDLKDNMLTFFYKNALMFVFPSLYEGFGVPILEAFSCECPIACSNVSSLPEIAQDAAIYFDPYSHESMCGSILKLLDNGNIRKEIIAKGKDRLKNFSWEKTAQKTENIYKELI